MKENPALVVEWSKQGPSRQLMWFKPILMLQILSWNPA